MKTKPLHTLPLQVRVVLDTTALNFLLEAAHKHYGWDLVVAENILLDYRRFIAMHLVWRGEVFSPSEGVDQMWQLHLLFPVKYANFCMKIAPHIAGDCFIDYEPWFKAKYSKDRHRLAALRAHTKQRRDGCFGPDYHND